MSITVHRVNIPAMSTIGYGWGTNDAGEAVHFVGDHRPMRDIGEAIAAAASADDLPTVDENETTIISVTPAENGLRGQDGDR